MLQALINLFKPKKDQPAEVKVEDTVKVDTVAAVEPVPTPTPVDVTPAPVETVAEPKKIEPVVPVTTKKGKGRPKTKTANSKTTKPSHKKK